MNGDEQMNIDNAIAELYAEMAAIKKAIKVLEKLSQGRPGRVARKSKPFSVETRKKMALVQRRRWGAVRERRFQVQPDPYPRRPEAAGASAPTGLPTLV